MYLVVIIFKNEKLLKKLVSIMIECGFFNTSIIDGQGVENLASQTIPIFSEVATFFGQKLMYNRTIISFVPNKNSIDDLIKLCKSEGIEFNDDNGIMVSLKVEGCYGNEKDE